MNSTVRVRFAPSPTGHLHIGSLRSALFNWLYARHFGGKFLIRIEDTDRERSLPEFTASILASFAWCSIEADEPIVIQSERLVEHQQVAHDLVARGHAYRCYCTQEELAGRLGSSAATGGYAHYDGRCREAAEWPSDVPNKPYVIRFKVPHDREEVVVDDLIRGKISFPIKTIDDFIIVRSDGSPMYNFVVVVDDAFMRISHIIRGEEHLVNTPLQILLYEACGYAMPQFAHLPLILAPDGTKLSKRFGAVSVLEYKQAGVLADALCNYLVRLGWSHGDQEIFTREEMIQFFTLEAVGKTGAIFDPTKLLWVNSMHIKRSSAAELIAFIVRDIEPDFYAITKKFTQEQLYAFADLYKDRVKTLLELRDIIIGLHNLQLSSMAEADSIYMRAMSTVQWQALDLLVQALSNSEYSRDALTMTLKKLVEEAQLRFPDLAQPIRLALTGSLTAPGVYELLLAFGKAESIRRLMALSSLGREK
jgi:glutamyl-tRNA synthetase